jgi:tetratricopeptide (TPR) repeat protein
MVLRVLNILIVLACLFAGGGTFAAEPLPPPGVPLSESATAERAALFAALADAKDETEARGIEQKVWKFWLSLADAETRALFEESRKAQLRFEFDEALVYLKALVVHAPQYSEAWNQLGYVLYLTGKYDAALVAVDEAVRLEPLHFAALVGKAEILIAQGKEAEAQAPLKRALAIDPWLRERSLLAKEPGRKI